MSVITKLEDGHKIHNHYDKDGKKIPYGEVNSGEVMTIQNEAYSIRELLVKFTSGVYTPQMVELRGMDPGEEFEESVMNSSLPEFTDRLDVENYVNDINVKKAKVKSKKATETTKKSADEEVKEQEKTEAKAE